MEKDEYDKQIAHLTANPNEIPLQYTQAIGLFKYLGNQAEGVRVVVQSLMPGCPVFIRQNPEKFKVVVNGRVNEQLTQQLAKDERIPTWGKHITIESLPAFAEWQRKFDKLNEL